MNFLFNYLCLTLDLLYQRQLELQKLASSEQQTREQMTYFKNELENRETNYNRRFVSSGDRGSRGRSDAAASCSGGCCVVPTTPG